MTPYLLRPSFAADLYLACRDPAWVQAYFGHKDIRMTLRYAKSTASAAVDSMVKARIAEKLPE